MDPPLFQQEYKAPSHWLHSETKYIYHITDNMSNYRLLITDDT